MILINLINTLTSGRI